MIRRRHHFARPSLLRATHLPAPTAGMNLVDPASALGPLQAISTVNLVKGERGLIARPGTVEQATHVGTTAGEVRSVLGYHGATAFLNRLFACAPDGIYNVTTATATPTRVLAFGTNDVNSGRGVGCNVTTAGGAYYLYADETNGLFTYDSGTDTWAATAITGLAAASVRFVTTFKNRVWVVEAGSLRAWYTSAGAVAGAVTSFDLQSVFQHGGTLAGIWAWSRDGGTGLDDYVAFLTTQGELAVYLGTDPANDFRLVGLFNLGGVPTGRRLALSYGGDLLFLTTQGVLPISKLVGSLTPIEESLYTTRPLQPLFVQTMANQSTRIGWEMALHPKAGMLVINTPGIPGDVQEQFVMSYSSKGWSRLQGLDILSSEVWDGEYYFGTRDGRVMKSSGYVDNVKLGGDTSAIKNINCFTIGGFSTLGTANYKTVAFVTPRFITHGVSPIQEALARYDFDIADAGTASGATAGTGSVWDSAVWDTSLWAGAFGTSEIVASPTGRGVNVAVGVSYQAQDYAILVGFDVSWTEEGLF